MAEAREDDRTVLIVEPEATFSQDASKLFVATKVVTARTIHEAQAQIKEDSVPLALLGPSYAHEAGVAEASLLLDVQPELHMVLVTEAMTTPLLRAALRAGFRDVIETPLSAPKVEEMLSTVERFQQRRGDPEKPEERQRLGRIVTVMSPKGGAGKTVTATNVALMLTAWAGPDRVVAVDADLQFGDVCLALQLDPKASIVDVGKDLAKLDEDLIRSVLMRHHSGLNVLPAPLEPSMADEVTTPAVVKIMSLLKRMFDYIVVDTAPFLDEPMLSILERSEVVLLVVDMDLPSVKNAKLALDTLRLIKYPIERIRLILNRANSKARLDVEELERSLGLRVRAAVPSNKLVPRSVNEGVPVVALYPRSNVARAYHDVARLVIDDRTAAALGSGRRKGRR